MNCIFKFYIKSNFVFQFTAVVAASSEIRGLLICSDVTVGVVVYLTTCGLRVIHTDIQ